MKKLKIVAIASELVDEVRATKLSPGYGHPVTAKIALGHGPCRHCLRPFVIGVETRLLFTYDTFGGAAPIPQPGPVFVHQDACERYREDAGFPAELVRFGAVLDGYNAQQIVRRRERIVDGSQETTVREMLSDVLVQYVLVRDLNAGCFDFRVDRGEG